MKGRSRIDGKPDKAGRHKTTPKRPRSANAVPNGSTATSQKAEIARLTRERDEALERQTATADILKVIASSPSDVRLVFNAVAESARRVLGGFSCVVTRVIGDELHLASYTSAKGGSEILERMFPRPLTGDETHVGVVRSGQIVMHADSQVDGDVAAREIARARGFRSLLVVPMLRDGVPIGTIGVTKAEPHQFDDNTIGLLKTFADQAVIAIENARLFNEVQAKTRDLTESLRQQTATADVLRIISRSAFDIQAVFDTLTASAVDLLGMQSGTICVGDGEVFRYRSAAGAFWTEELWRYLQEHPVTPGRNTAAGRVIQSGRIEQIPDIFDDPDYAIPMQALTPGRTPRAMLGVPLLGKDRVEGAMVLSRQEPGPFTQREVDVLQTFADQAVIAIQNARLLGELRESLEQQTATAEVLQVINSSPGNLALVFDALLAKALELCDAAYGILWTYEDGKMHLAALRGVPPAYADFLTCHRAHEVGESNAHGRLLRGEPIVHIADAAEDYGYLSGDALRRATVELGGSRTLVAVPLRKDDIFLGIFVIYRQEVKPFLEKQIALLQNFAAQAVIAMENARLLTETREALERQTATSEVLQVINTSQGELKPIFDAILDKALRLSHSAFGIMRTWDGTRFHLAAERKVPQAYLDFTAKRIGDLVGVDALGPAIARVLSEKRVLQIVDAKDGDLYRQGDPMRRAVVDLAGARTILFVPLLDDDEARGTIMVFRTEMRAFTDKEVALVQNFAAQAVIAIDNARLLDELRERQAELRVTFDNMGDGVALFDADHHLAAWNRNFQEILDLPDALVANRLTYQEYIRMLADRGEFGTLDNIEEELARRVSSLDRPALFARTRPDGKVIEARRNPVPGGGFVLIYSDITERKRAEAEISAARDAAEKALRDLQTAQASLLHSQKMAALGQLTAGVAHEIKNPLNFVNNFAALSVELLEELKEATVEAIGTLDGDTPAEILETIRVLRGNLERIAEHGRRADGIVRGMLQHSRGSSGDWQAADLNALVEESLNLAYHGARAQDRDFKVALELDLDRNLAPIEVVSQDVSRVLLNLISNGFYAVTKRGCESGGAFRPLLKIATREVGEGVEIRVRDNGVGVPPEHREKLFQPFFTTKPPGEGTGLGLSISYEIITLQHGGTITLDSEIGDFTEFTVRLPRRRHGVA